MNARERFVSMRDVSLERDLTAKIIGSREEACIVFLRFSFHCRFDHHYGLFCMTTSPATPDMAESKTVPPILFGERSGTKTPNKLHSMIILPYLLLELPPFRPR